MRINGDQVRKLREAKSWSQEHLADVAGVSVRTVQRVEADGLASAETRLALAAALDVPVSVLLSETGVANRRPALPTPAKAWVGLGVGTVCATAGVAFSYFSGLVDAVVAARHLGVVSGLAGGTLGIIGALRGTLGSRPYRVDR